MDELMHPINPSFTPINRTLSPPTKDTSPIPELFADATMSTPLRRSRTGSSHTVVADSTRSSPVRDIEYAESSNNKVNGNGRTRMDSIEGYGPCSVVPPMRNTSNDQQEDEDEDEDDFREILWEDLEQFDNYALILREANEAFQSSQKPQFCTQNRGEETKEVVEIATNKVVTLIFRNFNKNGLGYWEFTASNGDKYIAKYENGKYLPWLGKQGGFSKNAVAVPLKQTKVKEEWNVAERNDQTPSRALRPRNFQQEHPYKRDMANFRLQKKGMPNTDDDIQNEAERMTEKAEKKASVEERSEPFNKKRKRSCPSPSLASTTTEASSFMTSTTKERVSDEKIFSSTWLRTRIADIPNGSNPILLKEVTVDELLRQIKNLWGPQLSNRTINYCIVKFPWREEDANILLHRNNEECLKKLIEEVRHAPIWNDNGNGKGGCEVDVHIFTG